MQHVSDTITDWGSKIPDKAFSGDKAINFNQFLLIWINIGERLLEIVWWRGWHASRQRGLTTQSRQVCCYSHVLRNYHSCLCPAIASQHLCPLYDHETTWNQSCHTMHILNSLHNLQSSTMSIPFHDSINLQQKQINVAHITSENCHLNQITW